MKEQVEKSLGMTIEEYLKLCDEIDREYDGTEIEWSGDPIHNLSFEELDFFADYTRNM